MGIRIEWYTHGPEGPSPDPTPIDVRTLQPGKPIEIVHHIPSGERVVKTLTALNENTLRVESEFPPIEHQGQILSHKLDQRFRGSTRVMDFDEDGHDQSYELKPMHNRETGQEARVVFTASPQAPQS